ncbi:hypothetical protein CROQUDRAFT_107752 [Cronartium quercuum f. sp. fusiforme G11]|uniref:Uncharacterized protein n=1 Tax=Cronartium quercuum f. sp. fusiforme G11 TaxID=708437 RepID=A0A9P6TBA3_9BASI|nr:hypothetical protein CROQUDRAFT_107752 [Cronartium quercuum f. sp. fusiforme G11]
MVPLTIIILKKIPTPRSSRASLSRVFNNGLIIEHSKPISSLALSIKTMTTLCCFLILITNSIASPMELTRSFRGSDEIEELEPESTVASTVIEDSQSINIPELREDEDSSPYPEQGETFEVVLKRIGDAISKELLSEQYIVKLKDPEGLGFLLEILPFKHTIVHNLEILPKAIYIPPIEETPKYGIDPSTKEPRTEPEKGRREDLFRFVIRPRLQRHLKKIVKGDLLEAIQKAILDTTRLYPPPVPKIFFIKRYFNIARSWYAPSALEIFKNIRVLFSRSDVSMGMRQELWTFLMFHAFHSSDTENYLISLYRKDEFRQALIRHLKEFYGFDRKVNGLAWPMHKEVLIESIEQTPEKNNMFFDYHRYLLARELNVLASIYEPDGSNADDGLKYLLVNKNELMELLDRDVLISQLQEINFDPNLVSRLRAFPPNWHHGSIADMVKLFQDTLVKVESLIKNMPEEKQKLLNKVATEESKELQAAVNILLHLYAYKSQRFEEYMSHMEHMEHMEHLSARLSALRTARQSEQLQEVIVSPEHQSATD